MTGRAASGGAPIRVLAIDHTAGVVPFRRKFAALAAEPGIELSVLAPRRWVENYREVRAGPGYEDGYRFDVGRVAWPGYENRAFFVSGLAGAIRRARPDILHLWEEPFSFIALQALLLRRVLAPRAKALFFSSDNLARDFRYPYRPAPLYAAIERWVHRQCEAGTAVTEEVVEVLRAKGYRGPVDVVPHGLDLDAYPEPTEERRAAARARLGARGVVVGYAGRLLAMKGVDLLMRAFARATAQPGAPEATLVVVGEGPEESRLRDESVRLGLGERVRFLPPVPHERMPDVLAGFDVTAMPSLSTPTLREQFGRVAVEGMAAGTAVLVSDSGGLPYVVGDAGVVTPEGDEEALAGAIARLLASPDERAARATAGRERARRLYTWNAVASALAGRYRTLAEERPKR